MNPQPTITILEELKRFIPPMLPHERASLEMSLLREGCKTPLIVWRKQDTAGKTKLILVDGHNRKAICDKHNLAYQIEEKEFRDLGEVRAYMADFQNSRRNLNTLQRAYMIGSHYESLKQNALDNLKKRDAQAKESSETTANFIARQYATSESTVKRFYNLFQAMRTIEQINENALMLCFQCLNAKETTFVEFVAQASTETIMCINTPEDLFEAVKEGKKVVNEAKPKKNSKVQNELSTKHKEEKQQVTASELQKVKDKARNLERENEKHQKTIEQLQNRLDKQENTPSGFLFFYLPMPNGLDVYFVESALGLFKYVNQHHTLEFIGVQKMSDYQHAYKNLIASCKYEKLPNDLARLLFTPKNEMKELAEFWQNECKRLEAKLAEAQMQVFIEKEVTFPKVQNELSSEVWIVDKNNSQWTTDIAASCEEVLQRVVWVVDSVNSLTPKNKLQKACVDFAEKYKNVAFNDFTLLAETVGKEIEKLNKQYANCSFLKVSSRERDTHACIYVQPDNTTTPFEIAINATKITSVLQGANIETCLPNKTWENPQIGLIENWQNECKKIEANLAEFVQSDLKIGKHNTAREKLDAVRNNAISVSNFAFNLVLKNNLDIYL
jgi:hypothetical protein